MDGTTSSPGTNKRKWSLKEDEALVTVMLDLVNKGTHKADNGFKPGYLSILEKHLQTNFPGTNIKAKPHIESRIKTLKRDFTVVYDMLNRNGCSGFGFNSETKMVVADQHVWEGYCESYKGAAQWRNRSFPQYEDLLIVFVKDRAKGKYAFGLANSVEDLERGVDDANEIEMIGFEDFHASMSFAPSQVPMLTNVGECSSKKRRCKNVDFVGDSITQAAVIISDRIKEATVEFSKAIGVDRLQAEKREKIKGEIEKFTGLSRLDRHKSMMIFARDHEMTDIFFTLDENEREDFVMALLRGDI